MNENVRLMSFMNEQFPEDVKCGVTETDLAIGIMNKYRDIAFGLWRLLDNVDTIDGMCRGNDSEFRRLVNLQASKRNDILEITGSVANRYHEFILRREVRD